MARSRREQRVELQQAMQAKSAAPLSDTQSAQNRSVQTEANSRPRDDGAGRIQDAGGRAPNESSSRSFSIDPSPFTRRPTLAKDSSAYRELVALAAYYRAERRGFAPGGEVEDWLDAEREVAARLNLS